MSALPTRIETVTAAALTRLQDKMPQAIADVQASTGPDDPRAWEAMRALLRSVVAAVYHDLQDNPPVAPPGGGPVVW